MQQPNPPDYQVWCMGLEPKIDAQRLLWCLDSVLLVQDLKSVLRQLDLRVGGKKSELAARIKEYLDTLLASEDMEGYARVAALVTGFEIQRGAVYQNSRAAAAPREGHGPRLRPSAANGDAAAMPVRLGGPGASKALFPDTVFYSIVETFGPVCQVPASTHRNAVSLQFSLSALAVAKLKEPQSPYRLNLFCGGADMAALRRAVVEFPAQLEIRVNGLPVRQSLRGLKNRPGTVRPADITNLAGMYIGPPGSQVAMVYAGTVKRFVMQAALVKVTSVEELVGRVREGKYESKESVMAKFASALADDDVVATSVDITLKDPLSYSRITLPCQSVFCQHLQCFDATAFFQVNEVTPTWSCPVCNKQARPEDLVVGGYMMDILQNTPANAESVKVDPSGSWSLLAMEASDVSSDEEDAESNKGKERNGSVAIDLDGDTSPGGPAAATPRAVSQTPSGTADASPAPPSKRRRAGGHVVDLTGSDDDNEESAAPSLQPRPHVHPPGHPHAHHHHHLHHHHHHHHQQEHQQHQQPQSQHQHPHAHPPQSYVPPRQAAAAGPIRFRIPSQQTAHEINNPPPGAPPVFDFEVRDMERSNTPKNALSLPPPHTHVAESNAPAAADADERRRAAGVSEPPQMAPESPHGPARAGSSPRECAGRSSPPQRRNGPVDLTDPRHEIPGLSLPLDAAPREAAPASRADDTNGDQSSQYFGSDYEDYFTEYFP